MYSLRLRVFSSRVVCCLMEEKENQNVKLPPVVSPRVAERGARIQVLGGIIHTLRQEDFQTRIKRDPGGAQHTQSD